MFLKASEKFNNKKKIAENWDDFMKCLNGRNFVFTPWYSSIFYYILLVIIIVK